MVNLVTNVTIVSICHGYSAMVEFVDVSMPVVITEEKMM
jgi:hypothetical protein